MDEFMGAMGIFAGMLYLAVWFNGRTKTLYLVLASLNISLGLAFILINPNSETEKPAYSFEWIDEETKCHWYGGKIVNCETVRYVEEL